VHEERDGLIVCCELNGMLTRRCCYVVTLNSFFGNFIELILLLLKHNSRPDLTSCCPVLTVAGVLL